MDAVDLHLELIKLQGQQYLLRLSLHDSAISAPIDLLNGQRLPVTIDPADPRLQQFSLAEYGEALGQIVFGAPVALAALEKGLATAAQKDKPVRLRLQLEDELHVLPWETLSLPGLGPLALRERLRFSRFLSGGEHRPVPRIPPEKLRALVAVAAPDGLDAYDLPQPDRALFTAAAQDNLAGAEVTIVPGRLDAIRDGLRAGAEILYLVAHGRYLANTPTLFLEDDAGQVAVTLGADLATALSGLRTMPRLVVLVSCGGAGNGLFTRESNALNATGPLLLRAGTPAVVAMQGNFSVATAAAFVPRFFRELLVDGFIDRALAATRFALRERDDVWMPVLLQRLSDGRLWDPAAGQPGESTVSPAPLPVWEEYHKSRFVDRERQLRGFAKVLEPGDPYVGMQIHAPAGMGKTWLIHRLHDFCREDVPVTGDILVPVVKIDFSVARDIQDFLSLIRFMRDRLGSQHDFGRLNETIDRWATGKNLTLAESMRQAFAEEELSQLSREVLGVDPILWGSGKLSERIGALISHFQRRRELPRLMAVLRQQRPNYVWEFGDRLRAQGPDELTRAVDQISRAFLARLEAIVADLQPIVFFFDSYNHHLAAADTREWIRTRFMPWLATPAADGVVAVVTEEALPGELQTQFRLGARLVPTELHDLTERDIRQYLTQIRLLTPSEAEWQEALTFGKKPATLATIADVIERRTVQDSAPGPPGDSFWDNL
ncbi:MAG: CHAT domain-containing protein [Anaerolineales bacterium]|nr:CHAT domain-containing protein [Anaerolineales bacterium]